MDTRAILTHDEFVRIATEPEHDGWITGRLLLFRPEVTAIGDWHDWNSPANRLLNRTQRSVYALSSTIFYAHRSGGIVDWFERDVLSWDEILESLSGMRWPAMSDGLERAMRGQFPNAASPAKAIAKWRKLHAQQYKDMLKSARRIARRLGATSDALDEHALCMLALRFADEGLMALPMRVSDAAEEFGEWVRLGDAKRESVARVATWLIENEEGLRRAG